MSSWRHIADAACNIGVCGHEWCYQCLASWTQSARTNIPYCEHRPSCPERNANPFVGQNPYERTNVHPLHDAWGIPIDPYNAMSPYFRPLPYAFDGHALYQPGYNPASAMTPDPGSPHGRYGPAWLPRPDPEFGPAYATENVAFSNGPPSLEPAPPSTTPDAVDPRYSMRPNPLHSTRSIFGGPSPAPTPGRPHVRHPRAAARRGQRYSSNWQPLNSRERERLRVNSQYLTDETEQLGRTPVGYQRPSVEVGGPIRDSGNYLDGGGYGIWAPAEVQRPHVKVPMRPGG